MDVRGTLRGAHYTTKRAARPNAPDLARVARPGSTPCGRLSSETVHMANLKIGHLPSTIREPFRDEAGPKG